MLDLHSYILLCIGEKWLGNKKIDNEFMNQCIICYRSEEVDLIDGIKPIKSSPTTNFEIKRKLVI